MLECVKNDNGNHVIQKCIKWADPILLQSIVASIMGKVSLLIIAAINLPQVTLCKLLSVIKSFLLFIDVIVF